MTNGIVRVFMLNELPSGRKPIGKLIQRLAGVGGAKRTEQIRPRQPKRTKARHRATCTEINYTWKQG